MMIRVFEEIVKRKPTELHLVNRNNSIKSYGTEQIRIKSK